MMDIIAHDILAMGNNPDIVDEYVPTGPGLDQRPKFKELTLNSYLTELKLSPEEYERKY